MSVARKIFLVLMLVVFALGTWGAIYARSQGFTASWRALVEQEFDKRGYHVEITKLTLGPFRGLVAEDVRFFLDPAKKREYGSVDRIILDLDFSQILDKQLSLNMLEIRQARLSLPLDPAMDPALDDEDQRLKIRGISARIVVTESQIEVVDAAATVAGIDLKLSGIMTRPLDGEDESEKSKKELDAERKRQTDMLRQRRSTHAALLEKLREVRYLTDEHPQVEISFFGDVNDLASVQADLRAHGEQFRYGPYTCREADLAIRYDGALGIATLEELKIRDDQGDLRVRADWTRGKPEVNFLAESSADLTSLVSAFYPESPLREIVFYQSPRVKLEGSYRFGDGEKEPGAITGIGEFLCDRFGSRGEVFEGVQCDFSLADGKTYLRNVRLDHKSGVAWMNALHEPEGFRYEAEIKLDPRVFSPFFKEDGTRKFLSRWEFDDQSTVYVSLEGTGPSLDARTWRSTGKLDLRNCRFNEVAFDRMEADLEFDGPKQHYRNVRITRPEGEAESPEMFFDASAKRWRIDELRWNLDHVGATRAINPKLSSHLGSYGFTVPPTIVFDGEVDGRSEADLAETGGLRDHDFTVAFESPEPANYEFLGKVLPLENPRGLLYLTGEEFHLQEFGADLFGGEIEAEFKIATAGELKDQFAANVVMKAIPFQKISALYSGYEATEGSITGGANFFGTRGQLDSINGEGAMKIEGGDVFAIPMFGPLSKIAKGVLPNTRAGYSVAREASATFTMTDGVLRTDDLAALANAFRFDGAGAVNCVTGEVAFEATFNTKLGLVAALLTPISKLFEYQCTGTVSEPEWSPKALNVPRRILSDVREAGEIATQPLLQSGRADRSKRLRLKLPKFSEIFGREVKPEPAPVSEPDDAGLSD